MTNDEPHDSLGINRDPAMGPATTDRDEGHERRVQSILSRAGRELGMRDVMTFALGRMWTVLLSIGAALCAAFSHGRVGVKDGGPDDPSNSAQGGT